MERNSADASCSKEGATLVTIFSAEENSFVKSLIQGEVPWIDLIRDKNVSNRFVWYSGASLVYENWKNGEPNYSMGIEDCVFMDKNGSWVDFSCSHWTSFICKIGPPAINGKVAGISC